jgi:hypothetical protein
MRLFTSTMLADLSAAEVVSHLADVGVTLSVDDVEARCRKLFAERRYHYVWVSSADLGGRSVPHSDDLA